MIFLIVLNMIMLLAFLVFFAFNTLKSIHMFQLNSYKLPTHIRWLRSNSKCLLPGMIGALAVGGLLVSSVPEVVAVPITAVIFIVLAITQRPRKAKKPLVYTKRVIRLILTIALLLIITAALTLCSRSKIAVGIAVALLALLSPVIALAANVINMPVEHGIKQYYIHDAKRILADCPDLLTIGVTGSYGKTSVKYILHSLLQAEYDVLMTPESYNTPMGVVMTVRNLLRATHQIFVCEMGARHVGDIKELCDIVHPDIGIITSVGPQHLETFHTIENVMKTKFELADAVSEHGKLFLNGEDTNIQTYRSSYGKAAVSYGLSSRCDYYASDISVSSKGTAFTVHTPAGECETFTTRLLGKHNVINIVGAIAICHGLGIPLAKLKPQVWKLESVPHRLQMLCRGGITIIDDAYNSNPAGSRAAIDTLALFEGFKILVTPGMVELGEKQDELNKAFGAYAAKTCDYVILVGKRQTVSIYDGFMSSGYPAEKIYVADNLQDAFSKLHTVDSLGKEKIVLIENDLPDNF